MLLKRIKSSKKSNSLIHKTAVVFVFESNIFRPTNNSFSIEF